MTVHKTTMHQQAAYRKKNKEKLKLQQAAWREKNPDRVKILSAASSERRKNGDIVYGLQQAVDKLVENINVKLTGEQEDFLNLYMDEPRNGLYKTFKKRFNSAINKLQFNYALQMIKEAAEKQTAVKAPKIERSRRVILPAPNVPKTKNVYWVRNRNKFMVQFKKDGKAKTIGHYEDFEQAKAAAEEYRQNSA